MNANSNFKQEIRIPSQFKPEKPVEEGAFYPWVKLMMSLAPWLKREDLDPTEEDLKLISTLAYQNDDLGNAIAAAILQDRKLVKVLEKGLAEGLDSLDNPPPVLVEFLSHFEKLPEFLQQYQPDEDLAEKSRSIPIQWKDVPVVFGDALAMSMGFFIGANYPAVGKSMVCTGSIASGSNRMVQTLNFVQDVSVPNAFKKFGPGIQACAKVRLAHAFARMQIERKGGWDVDYYGLPISEFDNMIFLSGVFLSAALNGNGGSQLINSRVRGIIRGMQYGLGGADELLKLDEKQIFRFFNLCLAHLDDSPATASQIVKSFYDNPYFRPTDTPQDIVKRERSLELANLMSRFFFGNKMADEIGLGRWYGTIYLPVVANGLRAVSALGANVFWVTKKGPVVKGYALAFRLLDRIISGPWARFKVGRRTHSSSLADSDVSIYKGSFGVFKGRRP